MGNQCTCGRSLTDSCVGWGDLSHSEWQTKKMIVEAQVAAKEVHEEIIRLIYPDGSFELIASAASNVSLLRRIQFLPLWQTACLTDRPLRVFGSSKKP